MAEPQQALFNFPEFVPQIQIQTDEPSDPVSKTVATAYATFVQLNETEWREKKTEPKRRILRAHLCRPEAWEHFSHLDENRDVKHVT